MDRIRSQPLSRHWGGGTLSSSDGQRFPVPVRSRTATALPRYFGYSQGLTFYTWTSDQFSQYGTKVIPATVRDATYVLDAILDNETKLAILEHTTDTAGYTELVFALFDLLGIDQDRFPTLHFELEPVEAAFSLIGVGKIIQVVGRAMDIAAELQRVGLLPSVVGLGLDGYAFRCGERELPPLNAHQERGATRIIASGQRDRDRAVRGRSAGQEPIGIARVHFLADRNVSAA